ncbi:MAG: hypothetical protein AAGM16_02995 [Pseudomonadota bacterium]
MKKRPYRLLLVCAVLFTGCSTTSLELTAQEKLLLKERSELANSMLPTWFIEIESHEMNGMVVVVSGAGADSLTISQKIFADDLVQGAGQLAAVGHTDVCLWVQHRSMLREPSVHSCLELKSKADREEALRTKLDQAAVRINELTRDIDGTQSDVQQVQLAQASTAQGLANLAELFKSLTVRQLSNDNSLRINAQKFEHALGVLMQLQDATASSNEDLQSIMRRLQESLAEQ